jgi:hypothetical protein
MARKRVLGYVLLHRHGHRAPERNIFQSTSEIDLWSSLLPLNEFINTLSERYPLLIHEKNQKPQFDVKTRPFGCITQKGVHHLHSIGQSLGQTFPYLKNISNARVYATNYQRTQVMSLSLSLSLCLYLTLLGECPVSSLWVRSIEWNYNLCS